jgi:endo-1,4-beta-xylanase
MYQFRSYHYGLSQFIFLFLLIVISIVLLCSQKKPSPISQFKYEEGDTLRKYAEHAGLFIGMFAKYEHIFGEGNQDAGKIIGREFNLLIPEPCLWRDTELTEGVFNFAKQETMDSFADDNGMAIKSATGPWHVLNPEWLEQKSFVELGPLLERHTEKAMGRNKGRIKMWVVFNEVVNDEGNGFRNRQTMNTPSQQFIHSIWVNNSDTSLIKEAFRIARRVDPDALLFLNDNGNEEYVRSSRDFAKNKGKFFYDYVMQLKKEGIPIDGVGFQLHECYPAPFWATDIGPGLLDIYLKNIDKNVKRYAAQGLLVDFSEVDVAIKLSDLDLRTEKGGIELQRRLHYQAKVYEGLLKVALNNKNVVGFIVWGLSDKYHDTAPAGYGKALLFDEEFKPKPAYYSLLALLKSKAMTEEQQEPRINRL